ncbi:hypothetical protein PO878_02105 [Iamia majanohamensis]|uniref:Lipoprotein n=1 Tax=Iamia majanohamensis TaxID=467976 RepID=A0AAE9Y6K9_9ACTN|nr:hypothetical protein [Iamia majanohamensis]WCO67512.1 hypothetical protein PO878_02105 [Iamia majanohamensis]
MRRNLLALLCALALAAGACGDDDGGGDDAEGGAEREATVTAIMDSTGASEDEADCIVDGAVEEFGDEALDPAFQPGPEQEEAFTALYSECGVDLGG